MATKVLIVEADDDLREMLVAAAEERFQVDAVCSGPAMRDALARGGHEVVILNMALPQDDAVALAERAARRGCAVIVCPDLPDQFMKAASKGFYILVRPFTRHRVLDAIERALRHVTAPPSAEAMP